jgi:hypothetical protein
LKSTATAGRVVRFQIHYDTKPQQNILVGGSHESLGNWNPAQAAKLGFSWGGLWQVELVIPANVQKVEYKYLLVDESNGSTFWEGGKNRILDFSDYVGPIEARDTWLVCCLPARAVLQIFQLLVVLFFIAKIWVCFKLCAEIIS